MAEHLEIIDADGVPYDLDEDGPLRRLRGTKGRFMPPIERTADQVPFQPGDRLRTVRHMTREVAVPVRYKYEGDESTREQQLRQSLRTWAVRLDPLRGDIALRSTGPSGDARVLTCRYHGGLELDENDGFFPAGRQNAVLVFIAGDPYWYDESDIVDTYTSDAVPLTWFPFFPLRLGGGETFSAPIIFNAGDVAAWPVWTINGPGSELYLRNLTTGKILHLVTTLAAGDTVTIDTRPGVKTVTRGDGLNLFPNLDPTALALWPLERGTNSVSVEFAGTTGASSVQLNYKQRYLTA